MASKYFRVEFIDVGEQFAERARAVIEQLFALLDGGQSRVADGAAFMKILSLPRERRRPLRREPAILVLHRDTGGTKIRNRILAHSLRIARQHHRGFDRAAMYAVAQIYCRKQVFRR